MIDKNSDKKIIEAWQRFVGASADGVWGGLNNSPVRFFVFLALIVATQGFASFFKGYGILQSFSFIFVTLVFLLACGSTLLGRLLVTRLAISFVKTSLAINTKIFAAKRMSFIAKGFSSVNSGWANRATKIILFLHDRLKMRWINTFSVTTKMVAMQIAWKTFYKHLVNHAMGTMNLSRIAKSSVTECSERLPFPARNTFVKVFSGNFDFGKDTRKQFAVNWKSIRIGISHFDFTSNKIDLIRLG